jgi:membrane-bound serine protease (ClpP class)
LTLTAGDAQQWGYADGLANDRAAVLVSAGLAGARVVETAPGPAERLVRFLTNPLVASLLISFGLLLLLADLFTSGFGVVGAIGAALLAVFFWGHIIAGLAGWEGVVLVLAGLALIAVEVFVIPGFGVAGVLGLLALLSGLFLSLIDEQLVSREALMRAGSTVGLAVITIAVGGATLLWLLPQLLRPSRLVLQSKGALRDHARRTGSLILVEALDDDRGEVHPRMPEPEPRSLVGATGVALSDLRPGGFAQIDQERVDVVTRGDYISAGEPIEVVADEGYRRVVRRVG